MRGKGAYTVFVGNLGEGDHLEDLGVDGRIILKLIFTNITGACTDLALYRDKWRALDNAVMNLRVQ